MKLSSVILTFGVDALTPHATCYLPVDVYFLQDTTGSFIEDLPNVKAQIPSIISSINEQNPGSYFGVGEFRDKPYLYLGELSDYCSKLIHPLSDDVDSVQTSFGQLFASGGADLPESQLSAIIDSVNDPLIGWRTLVRGSEESTAAGARLIIMSTDAKPHDPGDYDLYPGTSPTYLTPYPDDVVGISANTLCRRYDYPSVNQMKAQLDSHDTYLAILTPEDDPEVTAKWRWINDDVLGNPSNFYQFIQNDSSDILDAILSVLSEVTAHVCAQTSTPEPEVTVTFEDNTQTLPVTQTEEPEVTVTFDGKTQVSETEEPEITVTFEDNTQTMPDDEVTVTPAGGSQSSDCVSPCEPDCVDPCEQDCVGLLVEVNDRPKKLVVEYEKRR